MVKKNRLSIPSHVESSFSFQDIVSSTVGNRSNIHYYIGVEPALHSYALINGSVREPIDQHFDLTIAWWFLVALESIPPPT